jgi:hypothetical protein
MKSSTLILTFGVALALCPPAQARHHNRPMHLARVPIVALDPTWSTTTSSQDTAIGPRTIASTPARMPRRWRPAILSRAVPARRGGSRRRMAYSFIIWIQGKSP